MNVKNLYYKKLSTLNKNNGDGCSENCIIETPYFCDGGSKAGHDTCGLFPNAKIKSISKSNVAQIEFSQDMMPISFSSSSMDIQIISISSGQKYEFEYSATWNSKKEIEIAFKELNILGDKKENLTFLFNQD